MYHGRLRSFDNVGSSATFDSSCGTVGLSWRTLLSTEGGGGGGGYVCPTRVFISFVNVFLFIIRTIV